LGSYAYERDFWGSDNDIGFYFYKNKLSLLKHEGVLKNAGVSMVRFVWKIL
jgi:hypothetical protein